MRIIAFLFAMTLATAAATASPANDVVTTIRHFVDGFNKGDTATVLATCAPKMSIIDDFSPHVWQGPTACADWGNAYDADAKRNGITGGIVTLGKPWRVDVTGDRAYAVIPASYAYEQHGKPVNEPGAVLTVALQKIGTVWRMTGWAWSRH